MVTLFAARWTRVRARRGTSNEPSPATGINLLDGAHQRQEASNLARAHPHTHPVHDLVVHHVIVVVTRSLAPPARPLVGPTAPETETETEGEKRAKAATEEKAAARGRRGACPRRLAMSVPALLTARSARRQRLPHPPREDEASPPPTGLDLLERLISRPRRPDAVAEAGSDLPPAKRASAVGVAALEVYERRRRRRSTFTRVFEPSDDRRRARVEEMSSNATSWQKKIFIAPRRTRGTWREDVRKTSDERRRRRWRKIVPGWRVRRG